MNDTVLDRVSRALGREAPLTRVPSPPPIDEPLARLVRRDVSLPELFSKRAKEMKMTIEFVTADELDGKLAAFLRENQCKKIALPVSPLLDGLNVLKNLTTAGFQARRWDAMILDELYEFDAGVTDVTYAVAETGSLVIRGSPEHGRAVSLVPKFHVAVIEQKNFVPDLVDLFETLSKDADRGSYTMITGPSKTSDIEMTLVVGVHGPYRVHLFILK
jgi:L-lactate dehydrogenase complex protein LldG